MNPASSTKPMSYVSQGWETTDCPLCGAQSDGEILRVQGAQNDPDYRLVKCSECSMGYLNPRPSPRVIGRYYSEDYEEYQPPVRHRSEWLTRIKDYLERLVLAQRNGNPPPLRHWYQKLLATIATPWCAPGVDSLVGLPFVGEGKLLDFGSGSGWYGHRMSQRGWKVTCMDFTSHAAQKVTERFGLPALVGTLPHPDVQPGSFDVITMGCVLEHVHEPQEVVKAAVQALRPGGLLVIAVPNLASWGFRYFGKTWWPLELPRHLLHFTPRTLRLLLQANGLEIHQERMLNRGGWMRRSLARAVAEKESILSRRLLVKLGRMRLISSLLTRWTVRNRLADGILAIARKPAGIVQTHASEMNSSQAA
jgi:2-polyprenyl-3-methyl-5-hydroxy-6-metoxy-1,4-benzoquinol methylase